MITICINSLRHIRHERNEPVTPDIFDKKEVLLLFQHGPKATMETNGNFEKGYITRLSYGSFHFSVHHGRRSVHELWEVAISHSAHTWDGMMTEKTLLTGHKLVSSFLHPFTQPHLLFTYFVSARSLECDLKASNVAAMHP